MGRVFDAMKRHSATEPGSAEKAKESKRREESPRVTGLPSAQQIEEQLLSGSSIMSVGKPARNSASTAHTADVPGGSALPGGIASRDAGATLDAAGATRAGGFVTYDVSPARVEPHLVAISQPRSAYTEQFRSLRTKIFEAAERKEMRAIVVTSAGVAEGKTLTALNLAWLLAQTDGVRALIIDSDLRSPCATDYLGIDAQDYRTDRVDDSDIRRTQGQQNAEEFESFGIPGHRLQAFASEGRITLKQTPDFQPNQYVLLCNEADPDHGVPARHEGGGAFRTLHDINSLRLDYIAQRVPLGRLLQEHHAFLDARHSRRRRRHGIHLRHVAPHADAQGRARHRLPDEPLRQQRPGRSAVAGR